MDDSFVSSFGQAERPTYLSFLFLTLIIVTHSWHINCEKIKDSISDTEMKSKTKDYKMDSSLFLLHCVAPIRIQHALT